MARMKTESMTRWIAAAAGLVLAVVVLMIAGFGGAEADLDGVVSAEEYAANYDNQRPRNVILLIGDGTDESILTAARNYHLGPDGKWELDKLPFVGDMTVFGIRPGGTAPLFDGYNSRPNDSAATATAWSTGQRTLDGRIGQAPTSDANTPGADLPNLIEKYKAMGKRTGNITTDELTGATPGAAGAHVRHRDCMGPTNMGNCASARKVNGGKGSIAEQLVDNGIDVLLGGGRSRFTQATDAGPTVLARATSTLGYRDVQTEDQMNAITSLDQGPVLGTFSSGVMAQRFNNLQATAAGSGSSTYRCTDANRGTQPTLAEMTQKAINLLQNDGEGFFLQIESSEIDKSQHDAEVCGAMGDVLDLDQSLGVALDFQEDNPDTLIVITGDHGHSTQIVPSGTGGAKQTATVQAANGKPMTLGYSTQGTGAGHVGHSIRIAAKGPMAANVSGLIGQDELHYLLLGQPLTEKTEELEAQVDDSDPKSVILLIGDGTDESILTAARNYHLGPDGKWELDKLPFVGDMTVFGIRPGGSPPLFDGYNSRPNDSAATATAWSTGQRTLDGRIGQGPTSDANTPGVDLPNLIEKFKAAGKRTGNVTTDELTGATPGGAGAHVRHRDCHGPTNMSGCSTARKVNGGKGSIAEQLVDNRIDVLLGGGRSRFTQATDAGPTVLAQAMSAYGYRDIQTETQLDAVTSLDQGPVIGTFTSGTMSQRYNGLVATAAGTGSSTYRCTDMNRGTQPTLAEMTSKAIELLDKDNSRGFFLQVESSEIDKSEHDADVCGAIGDVLDLDQALAEALDYQEDNPDTLIVITADHAHSTQIVVSGTGGGRQTATVMAANGKPMTIAYSTQTTGASHTGNTVRIAAKGPRAYQVAGLVGQDELHHILLSDGTAPTTVATTTPSAPNGGGGYFKTAPTVTLTATEGASPVARTEYRLGTTGTFTQYTAPFAVTGQGTTTVQFRSIDTEDSEEDIKSIEVRVDSAAPTADASFTPGQSDPNGPISTNITATDTVSGVDKRQYRVDLGPWVDLATGAQPPAFTAPGEYRLDFRAWDVAGNVSATQMRIVRIGASGGDPIAPTTTAGIAPAPAGNNGWHRTKPVTVTLTGTDDVGGSGVASTQYRLIASGPFSNYTAPFQVTAEGSTTLGYRSTDNAGNIEAAQSTVVKIDTVAPQVTRSLSPASPGNGGIYASPVTISLGATDATSGLASLEYSVNGGAFTPYTAPVKFSNNGTYNIVARATDNAGNVTTDNSTSVHIDPDGALLPNPLSAIVVGGQTGPATVMVTGTHDPIQVARHLTWISSTGGLTWDPLNGGEPADYSGALTFSTPGMYRIDLFGASVPGGTAITNTVSTFFTVAGTPPPTYTITSSVTPKKKKLKTGKQATFTLKFVNNGPGESDQISVCASAPKGKAKIVGSKCVTVPNLVSGDTGTVKFKVKRLAKGKSATITYKISHGGLRDTLKTNV